MRPTSTTNTQSSIVIDVSAMFVDMTIFRTPWKKNACLLNNGTEMVRTMFIEMLLQVATTRDKKSRKRSTLKYTQVSKQVRWVAKFGR